MKKDLGIKSAIFPMPVLMIATYDENGNVNVMNAAWGTMVETDTVALNLSAGHKTTKNIMLNRAFTVSLADAAHVRESDYLGIVSGNREPDKFAKSGLHAIKSEHVNAPIIEEYPVCMECELIEYQDDEFGLGVIGRIVNVVADETVLDDEGNVDVSKIDAISFDPFRHGYYVIGEKVGNAFSDGKTLK